MRIAAGAVLVVVAMFALSVRAEDLKSGDELINWEGKRDPFSAQLERGCRIPNRGDFPPEPPSPYNVDEIRTQMTLSYAKAEQELTENPTESLVDCDRGLEPLANVPEKDRAKFDTERNRLMRLRTAAERLRERENAERDFRMLNLTLTGVVQSKQARAILNSQVVSRGEVIAIPNSSQIIVVTDIRDDKVIVRFRGFLMSIDLVDRKG